MEKVADMTLTAVTVLKTLEPALVQRREAAETAVKLRTGQTRLFANHEVSDPYPCCPVCLGRLDGKGACPHADEHAFATARFMASSKKINRQARRKWAARANYMGRKIRRKDS